MKLAVLALDYDGTIARDDTLSPAVRGAIAALREGGITVLLVTGRILDELRRVAGDLHFVDGVVAENGAVLHLPASGVTTTLAPEVPPAFLVELRRRGITFRAGQCLVDAAAADAPGLLDAIQRLELPLVLLFNRSRVMVCPQAVSKATGLRAALDRLRRSPRNTLAIGDAENDHELLRLAEVGAAVEWGSASLKSAADVVISGCGPEAVAAFVRPLAERQWLPLPPRARRRLVLGYTPDGREFSLAVRGRNVLVAGDVRSGKSWIAGLLCEQLILHGYCVCVIDPEGDYRSLEALPGVTALGGEDPPPTPRELSRALRYPDRSVIVDLSRLPHEEKIAYIRALLPALTVMRRHSGLPHRILVDEAHYFLHEAGAYELLDFELNGYTVVTYCASRLPPKLLEHTEVMIVTCESSPAEIESLRRICTRCAPLETQGWTDQLASLPIGEAVALPVTEEAGGQLRRFSIAPRITPHVRHRMKYVDVPVSDWRAFVFPARGRQPLRRARTLREFVAVLEADGRPGCDEFLRRGDFSRWIGEVFGDRALADEIRVQEERAMDDGQHSLQEIADAIRARYDLSLEPPAAERRGRP